jgi:DNA primase large subunit
MVSSLFINPFSEDAREIVRNYGSPDTIFEASSALLDTVKRTRGQNLDDNSLLPVSIGDLAIKRLEWYLRRQRRGFDHGDYAYLMNPGIEEYDVIAFYVLAQAAGAGFRRGSREVRLVVESAGALVEDRFRVLGSERDEIIEEVLIELGSQGTSWMELSELIGSGKLRLTDLILHRGRVVIDEDEFLMTFQDRITDRDPRSLYAALVGLELKETMISRIIMQRTEDYIERVSEMSSTVEPHPIILETAERIRETVNEVTSFRGGPVKSAGPGKLVPDAFPPCIRGTLDGVKSGNRNDAIVLLLTSFISYARLYPSVFRDRTPLKVSDLDPDLRVIREEILPIIYEAAERCEPPLFEDDPQEKLNITAKLGFGVHDEPEPEHEGESKWYTPMSCEKIKIHLPDLCRPDELCRRITNPLTYYNRKRWELHKGKSEQEGED